MHHLLKKLGTPIVLAGLFLVGGCETTATTSANADAPLPSGFTCCNFHHEDDWISDSNYANLPMIPAGTPATATGYGRYRAYAMIGGQKMRLGLDYGRKQQTLADWTAKMIVSEDINATIATYPKNIQDIIRQGKITQGMTKEQVIISVGYPLTSENFSLDLPEWRMWVSSFGEYRIVWDDNGRLKVVLADDLTRHIIYAEQ